MNGAIKLQNEFYSDFDNILAVIKDKKPLVHHITNYVTVNDCANIVLAIGASPVMADDIQEVTDIVSISSALVLNIGTLNQRTIESMLVAGKAANQKGIPVVLDPVGAGASHLRTDTAARLIQEVRFSVIRGNLSEMKAIDGAGGSTRGVDAGETDTIKHGSLEKIKQTATDLAQKIGCVSAITGITDVVSDGTRCYFIKNGHSMMAGITGTGCMCTSLVGSFCGAVGDYTIATAAAVMTMGIAGQLAYERMKASETGSGSYRSYLIDQISMMTDQTLFNQGDVQLETV